jgi:putative ABC transport system substrate-binding protein
MKYFLLLITLALLFLAPAGASGDILVVQSLQIKPYDEALRGCKAACKVRTNKFFSSLLNEAEVTGRVRKLKPDLILAIGQDALVKLREIRDVPIVYVMVLNPRTLIHENGNITGVSMNLAPEKQLSLLRQLLPNLKKISLLYDPEKNGPYVGRVYNAAALLGIELLAKGVHSSREALAAIDGMSGNVDALWLIPDTTIVNPSTIDILLLTALENKIPVLTFSDKYVEKGALLSMEVDAAEAGRQAGDMANRILNGEQVKNVEKEDARGSILTVNLIVAKKLGISLNGNLLKQARIIR